MLIRSKHRIIDYYCRIDTAALGAIMFVLALGFYFASGKADLHNWPRVSDLPRVAHGSPMRSALREDAITIAVELDGGIYFPGVRGKVSADALPGLIREKLKKGSERRVFIRADVRARYRDVRHVLQSIQLAQVEKVSFLAGPYIEQPTNILR